MTAITTGLPDPVSFFTELAALDQITQRRQFDELLPRIAAAPPEVQAAWRDALPAQAKVISRRTFDARLKALTRAQLTQTLEARGAVRIPTSCDADIVAVPGPHGYALELDGRVVSPIPWLHAVATRRDGRGVRCGSVYLLSANNQPDQPRHEISDAELSTGAYIDRLGVPIPEDRTIRESIVTFLRIIAYRLTPVESTARWIDGRLVLPPMELLPAGYLDTTGTEQHARDVWRDIAHVAAQRDAENLALCLGGALGSLYVRPLNTVRPVSFALTAVGAPRRGKSTCMCAAAAVFGSPILINPPLSESAIALSDQLARLGCLPLFRDETHSAGWQPAQWKECWMRVLNGAGRRRSDSRGTGQTRYIPDWWGAIFASGNVDTRYGATDGVQARVIVLGDPHLPDAATADKIIRLLGEAYGWPIHWFIANHPTPERFRDEYLATALADIGEAPAGSPQTVAYSLAVCVAGAAILDGLVSTTVLRAAALAAAHRALRALTTVLEGTATQCDDQLLADVWEDANTHPAYWPTKEEYESLAGGDRAVVHGIRHEHRGHLIVSVFPSALREIAERADYAVDQALEGLRARGLLAITAKMGYRHQLRLAGGRKVNVYSFHTPPDSENTPNDPNPDQPHLPTDVSESANTAPAPVDTPQPVQTPAAPADTKPPRFLTTLEKQFTPSRRVNGRVRKARLRASELPGITWIVHQFRGWAWRRPHHDNNEPITVLDRNAAYLSAAASALVGLDDLSHTGPLPEFNPYRAGYCLVQRHPWLEPNMPDPLRGADEDTVWVPWPVAGLLHDLARAGRWPDLTVRDSYTSEGVRLTPWTNHVRDVRARALKTHGSQSPEYQGVKDAFSQAIAMMGGKDQRPRENCLLFRPDWMHTIQAQSAVSLWRCADACRRLAPDHPPVAILNTDELHIPTAALDIVTRPEPNGRRAPIRLDQSGVTLGTFKIKERS